MPYGKVGAILIVGGGVAGIQASLDAADSGFRVYLVDRGPSIGGVMAQLDKTFPTNDCSMCILSPKLVATGRHPNITIVTNAEITGLNGEAGNFEEKLRKAPRKMHRLRNLLRGLQGKCNSIRSARQRSHAESGFNHFGSRIRTIRRTTEERVRLRTFQKRGHEHRVRTHPERFRTLRRIGLETFRRRDSKEDSFHPVRWFAGLPTWQQLLLRGMLHVRDEGGSDCQGTHSVAAGRHT